jgi:hypothetical protein
VAPFEGRWTFLYRVHPWLWRCSKYRYWLRLEVEEAARAHKEAKVVESNLAEPLLALLNG